MIFLFIEEIIILAINHSAIGIYSEGDSNQKQEFVIYFFDSFLPIPYFPIEIFG